MASDWCHFWTRIFLTYLKDRCKNFSFFLKSGVAQSDIRDCHSKFSSEFSVLLVLRNNPFFSPVLFRFVSVSDKWSSVSCDAVPAVPRWNEKKRIIWVLRVLAEFHTRTEFPTLPLNPFHAQIFDRSSGRKKCHEKLLLLLSFKNISPENYDSDPKLEVFFCNSGPGLVAQLSTLFWSLEVLGLTTFGSWRMPHGAGRRLHCWL